MGCKKCDATEVTATNPLRKQIRITFGTDLILKLQGVKDIDGACVPFNFDNGSFEMGVFDCATTVAEMNEAIALGTPNPADWTFLDVDFARSQSEDAAGDEDIDYNDFVTLHSSKAVSPVKDWYYEAEYPFYITFTDASTGQTIARWVGTIWREGPDE